MNPSIISGILSFVTAWVDLEDVMLRETNQAGKTNTARGHVCVESNPVDLTEAEVVAPRAGVAGRGRMGGGPSRDRVLGGHEEEVFTCTAGLAPMFPLRF